MKNINYIKNNSLPFFHFQIFKLANFQILFAIIFISSLNTSFSKSFSWTGSNGTGSWNDQLNWNPSNNGYPGTSDTVTIGSTTNQPHLINDVTVKKFTITVDTLDLQGYTLTITGVATFTSGMIKTGLVKPSGTQAFFSGTYFDARIYAVVDRQYLHGSIFNDTCFFEHKDSTNTNGNGGNTFNKPATFLKDSTSKLTFWSINNASGNTFNDQVTFLNKSTGNLIVGGVGNTYFNGNVKVGSNASGDIDIGSANGDSSFLASGKTISADAMGFSKGTLLLRNFTHNISTPLYLTISGTSILNCISSRFTSDDSLTAPSILIKNNVFSDTIVITQTGTATSTSYGGNIFNHSSTIALTTSALFRLGATATDTFNANVNFSSVSSSGDALTPCYQSSGVFKGNIYSTGKVTYDGSITTFFTFVGNSNQTIGGTSNFQFKNFIINKPTGGTVTLDTSISIVSNLYFFDGKIISTNAHLLTFNDGSTYSLADNSSFVSGPVKKKGNGVFKFPVGKGNYFFPIEISAPSTSTDSYTAEYFDTGYFPDSVDNTLLEASNCNYWSLQRNTGSSNVKVKLYYTSDACFLYDTTHLQVAGWNGSHWTSRGPSTFNGSFSLVSSLGTVETNNAVSSFSYFTLAPDSLGNTLFNHLILVSPDSSQLINDTVYVNKWEKLEFAFKLPRKYTTAVDSFFNHYYANTVNSSTDLNPYAGDSLQVKVDFISPYNVSKTVYAFYMRQSKWTNNNDTAVLEENATHILADYNWHVRFAPDVESPTVPWKFIITISAPLSTGFPTYTYIGIPIMCDHPLSDNHGYLKVNTSNNRYLKFEDNTPFFGIGENVADNRFGYWWQHSKWPQDCDHRFFKLVFEQYKKTFDQMFDAGANYIRSFMIKFNFAVEWDNLGVYDHFESVPHCGSTFNPTDCEQKMIGNRQYNCQLLDSLFDLAREKNIYLQLCVDAGFPANAYQSFIWGDLASVKYLYNKGATKDSIARMYLTDSTLRYYMKRKYKYILSRWGYSTNLALMETFNELDGLMGYYNNQWVGDNNCSPDINYVPDFDSLLKPAVVNWHNDILGYVKKSISNGGLGENKHLYTASFAGGGITNYSPSYTSSADYHSLFSDSLIDITDVHTYLEDSDMMQKRYISASAMKTDFADKPFAFGEIGSMGPISFSINGDTIIKNINEFYNNYETTFHNELWASTFMGGFTTAKTWFWEIVHRWKWGTREIEGDVTPMNVRDFVPPYSNVNVQVTTNTYYHNYKPVSEFASLIDFSKEYLPQKYFGDTIDYIESYYLKTTDSIKAYGWVHNINKYWANNYYYSELDTNSQLVVKENYYGCERLPQPSTSFSLSGFKHNHQYYIGFAYTRMDGQTLPSNLSPVSNSSGSLLIDLSSSPLGCDSTNADYAFVIDTIPISIYRLAHYVTPHKIEISDLKIYPNPSNGKYNIICNLARNEKGEITINDLMGNIISKTNINSPHFVIDLSMVMEGVYYLKYQNGSKVQVKKLFIIK